jgi:hypothetical protein
MSDAGSASTPATGERTSSLRVLVVDYARAFAVRPRNWLVLARNLIPVFGIYAFDWSVPLLTFNYWFDGVTALAALWLVIMAMAYHYTPKPNGVVGMVTILTVAWIILFGMSGMPYWLMLDREHAALALSATAVEVWHSPTLLVTFAAMAAGNFWRPFATGLDRIKIDDIPQRIKPELGALIARPIVMTTIVHVGLVFLLVPLLAVALTVLEVRQSNDKMKSAP